MSAYRKKAYGDTNFKCGSCGGELLRISDKFRIPKKNRKDWDKFIEWLKNYNPYYKAQIENFNKTLTK